jgi:hypothetical protein
MLESGSLDFQFKPNVNCRGDCWDVRQYFARQLFGFSLTMQKRSFLVYFFYFLDTFLVNKKLKFEIIEINPKNDYV